MFKELNILTIFLEDPDREVNVREFARIKRISPATASSSLLALKKSRILTQRKERNLLLYKSNLDSELYRDIKVFYNIRKIKDSGLIEALNKFYLKPTIIFFGSASTGTDKSESDIDLVIISEKDSILPKFDIYEKKLKRTLQLFPVKDLRDLKNKHLINNVLNGIVIQGSVKWI